MKLEDSFGFIMNYAGRKLTALLSHRFQPYDITTEQWSVLKRLTEEDGISQKELAHRVAKDQPNVTRILDQLERKSLTVRKANEGDRRSFLAYVTESGRALTEILAPIEQNVLREALAGLTDEQIEQAKQVIRHLTGNVGRLIEETER